MDCGAAVAHIMQPAIREYYHLEEIWGGKSVRMKVGEVNTKLVKASEPEPAPRKAPAAPVAARKAANRTAAYQRVAAKAPARKASAAQAPAKKAAARPARKAPRPA